MQLIVNFFHFQGKFFQKILDLLFSFLIIETTITIDKNSIFFKIFYTFLQDFSLKIKILMEKPMILPPLQFGIRRKNPTASTRSINKHLICFKFGSSRPGFKPI